MTKKVIPAHKLGVHRDDINHDAFYVIDKLQKSGFDGYVVGGGIRDLLLGKRPKDFDIVTNATPEQVHKLFRRNSIIIGRRFKIVHIIFSNINPDKFVHNRPIMERHVLEISTYRSLKINKSSLNEHGKIMSDNNYGTQKEDSRRRDFTINALFYDPVKEVIIDYNDGLEDVKNHQLRMIGEPELRFKEDPVRMIRAIRLSTKLGLTIDKNISDCFDEAAQLLLHENKSRLYEEMLKILLSGHGCKCIEEFKKLKLPRNIFPLLDILFLGKKTDAFAYSIVEKTDTRLIDTPDVSIIFILSGLFWSMINQSWQKQKSHAVSERDALIEAIYENRDFAFTIGITKNTYTNMRDVWLLQFDLEFPTPKRVHHTFIGNRFRQAWHLFTSRNEFNQVNKDTYSWWNSYIEGDHVEQELLLAKLDNKSSLKKKPRKARKSKSKSKT